MNNDNDKNKNCEIQSGDDVFNGYISGLTFKNKPVEYTVVDGMAIFEGDIILGTEAEMKARTLAIQAGNRSTQEDNIEKGITISGDQYRWPNALVPYDIDASLPSKNRVTDAIAHWISETNINFVLRTAANAGQYPNYVRFRPGSGCSSSVGMRGGRQFITLANGCSTGNTMHEIGHAIGLWHEQSRSDRGTHVNIHLDNVEEGREGNFNKRPNDGDDYGAYDYDSIMHYSKRAFSKNGLDTITTKPIAGIPIGQRAGLSPGDINAAHSIYTTWFTNKSVSQVFTTYDSQNSWIAPQNVGWRKIKTGNTDGVTNCFIASCEAKANNRTVNIFTDDNDLKRIYLN